MSTHPQDDADWIDRADGAGDADRIDRADGIALAVLLDRSSPQTPFADEAPSSDLDEMVRRAAREMRRTRRRRVTPRSVALGTVLVLALGGAGAAAAATISRWQPWAENPDATVHFTLPSGSSCEYRIVARDTGDPADYLAARDYLTSTDVLALADIDGELSRVRAREVAVRGDSSDAGTPATGPYSDDELYRQAVSGAVLNVIWDELEARGIVDPVAGSDLSFASQTSCDGEVR